MSGDDVRRLTRHVLEVERHLGDAERNLDDVTGLSWVARIDDARQDLAAAKRALEDLVFNVPRGLG